MPFPSEPDMMSKELQNSDLIYVKLMTDVLKLLSNIVGKLSPDIAIYRLGRTSSRRLAKTSSRHPFKMSSRGPAKMS